jgi:hypothetical protein
MVIMDGSPKALPWMPKCHIYRRLFSNCKFTSKPLFMSGFGIQFISHFCAVGGIEIIVGNNNGKGDSYEAIH